MNNNDYIKVFKALAEKSRILIINALMEKPMYVELLAERLDLSASTVSFHLKKLEEAKLVYSVKDQYYMMYHLDTKLLNMSIKDLIKVEDVDKKLQEDRLIEHRNKVLNAFFQYGKLKSIPVQRKKRKIVLEEIAKAFEKGKVYTEREVNIILADFHDDFCTLRRSLIEEQLMTRDNGVYQLI